MAEEECQLHDKECMLFASTAITNGGCTAVVNSTGMATEIGKIQAQIQEAAEEEEDTPLKKKLNAFGETLAQVRGMLAHHREAARGLTMGMDKFAFERGSIAGLPGGN